MDGYDCCFAMVVLLLVSYLTDRGRWRDAPDTVTDPELTPVGRMLAARRDSDDGA